jgi:uncharacterized damage-inducible protein DinB
MTTSGQLFLDYSIRKLEQQNSRLAECLRQLNADQVWARGNEHSNSIGNLILHLSGNVRQWIGGGVAGFPDTRQRDEEFSARGGLTINQLTRRLDMVVNEAIGLLRVLPESRLTEPLSMQGYNVTVLEGIYHVVEHFSHHTGQVILLTKLHTRRPLDFYGFIQDAHHGEATP